MWFYIQKYILTWLNQDDYFCNKESLYATSMTQADITDDKKTFNEKKGAYSKIMKPVQT